MAIHPRSGNPFVSANTMIGVMSPDFEFSLRAGGVDIWIPVPLETRLSWGNATRMIARLKPGVSLESAQAALSAAAKHVDETEHPYAGPHGEDAGYGVKVVTLHDQLLGGFRTVTVILLCAVAAVLLIACVNVANLLLARAVSREKETAVRRALGASGARLVAQWISESAVLAALGGTLGAIAAIWGVRILVKLSPAALPGVTKIAVDGRALATLLAIGAGLLLKSFSRLTHVDPGFNPSHLMTLRTDFTRNTSAFDRVRFYTGLREKLASLPGVLSAAVGDLPLRGGGINAGSGDPFGIDGKAYDSTTGPARQFAKLSFVGADYFKTLQIPLLAGRAFTALDSAGAVPNAVIVNETLARAFFPQGAAGRKIGVPPPCRDTKCDFTWTTIIGVAGDVKTTALDLAPQPQIYIPQPGGA